MSMNELVEDSQFNRKFGESTQQLNEYENLQMYRRLKVRKHLVSLVFVFYWLLVFEGALRKWGLPQFEEFIVIIRFPVIFVMYAYALWKHVWPRRNWILYCTYAFGLIGALLAVYQMLLGGYEFRYLIIVGYGWYMYFFYIPMAIIIGIQFQWNDIKHFMRLTMWFAIASFLLMLAQSAFPRDAIINMGTGTDLTNQFRGLPSALDSVRPTGFFTAPIGLQMFGGIAVVFVLFAWLDQSVPRSVPNYLRWASTIAVAGIVGISQNRGLVFQIALILLSAIIAVSLTRQKSKINRIIFWLGLLAVSATILWPIFLPTSFNLFLLRLQQSSVYESNIFALGTVGRALYEVYSFVLYIKDTPALGYLLGIGANVAINLTWVQLPVTKFLWSGYGQWGEFSLSKHIIEFGPYLGLCFILLRWILTIYLGWLAFKSTYYSKNTLPFLLFGFIGIILFMERFTSHVTVNGFCWLIVGITLAACRIFYLEIKQENITGEI